MPDVQNTADHRNQPIDQVGIRGVRYPVLIRSEDGGTTASVGEFSLSVGLPAHQKGTHMSRFVELLESMSRQALACDAAGMREMLLDMLQRLAAEEGKIELEMPFFMMKTAPVSGVQSMMDYKLRWSAEGRREKNKVSLQVKVPVKSLCPCSKEISDYGAHNQRSEVTVSVDLSDQAQMHAETLIRRIEAQASCELWGLLKRPDEKYVTERAYDNPKFVEDLVRDVAQSVAAVPGVTAYRVEAENFESIHNHSAWARIVSP
jgi:GTP cyclohydrolase I